MSPYQQLKRVNAVVGASRPISRIAAVVGGGADSSPNASTTELVVRSRPASFSDFLDQVRAEASTDVRDGVGTVVGAAAGALLWREHRVLGFIGGASIGRNVPALLDADKRLMAWRNMSATGGGVVGALLWREHPIWGFILGNVAASTAAYFAGLREAA